MRECPTCVFQPWIKLSKPKFDLCWASTTFKSWLPDYLLQAILYFIVNKKTWFSFKYYFFLYCNSWLMFSNWRKRCKKWFKKCFNRFFNEDVKRRSQLIEKWQLRINLQSPKIMMEKKAKKTTFSSVHSVVNHPNDHSSKDTSEWVFKGQKLKLIQSLADQAPRQSWWTILDRWALKTVLNLTLTENCF